MEASPDRALEGRVSARTLASLFGLWLLGSGLLFHGAARYYPFLADDTLISLRYADRLVHGLGLTWDAYHPVEGYTNLLWTLSTAALGFLGVDLVQAARVVCTLSSLACLAVLVLTAGAGAAKEPRAALLPATLAAAFFALSGNIQAWSVGGLEQTQLAFILLAAFYSHLRYHDTERSAWLKVSAVLHFFLVFTRPDSALFCAASICATWWLGTRVTRRAGFVWLVAATSLALLFKYGFSFLYYGEWVPNTAHVKLALTTTRVRTGFDYLVGYLKHSALLFATLMAYLVLLAVQRRLRWGPLCYVALAFVAWSAYVVLIGGDIFPAERHCIALTALACWAFAAAGSPALSARFHTLELALVLASCVLFGHARVQQAYAENRRAETERWEFPCADFASHLGQAFREQQPLVAVYAAGCMGYFSRLPALDMYGLNDWQIARNRPEALGEGLIGHEFGRSPADAEYVLQRHPDLFIHHIGNRRQPFFLALAQRGVPSAKQLRARYREISFKHEKRTSWALLSRESKLVSARVQADGTLIFPALALEPAQPGEHATARLSGSEALYVLDRKSDLKSDDVTPGSYRVQVEQAGKDALDLHCNGQASSLAQVREDRRLHCSIAPAEPGGSDPLIRSVTLTRLPTDNPDSMANPDALQEQGDPSAGH